MTYEEILGIVRLMIDRGVPQELAIDNPVVPADFREQLRAGLNRERTLILEPARVLVAQQGREEWLRLKDRSTWYYWPELRQYLIGFKNWEKPTVRSLDEATDRILGQLVDPISSQFDIRGLVLGFVQSGKTASFTALIAKAADVGYRLIIVLSGIDNGLRKQTQIRLKKELIGYPDSRAGAVRLPPMGHQWHEFTREELDGDFRPGFANHAALQGSQPVLLVVKKNGSVLRRLMRWLDDAPDIVRRTIPLLMIDDEADQASVDTRGTYQTEDGPLPTDYESPSVINGLIRELLNKFSKRAYVAYTATPFANILIPHDTFDPRSTQDLYPRDFIVDLPKPDGYFGAEELFGRVDASTGQVFEGLNVIKNVSDEDLQFLDSGTLPPALDAALIDFVLAGAGRLQRGQGHLPATMLVHTSQRILDQNLLCGQVNGRFAELRDEWRYHRNHGIRERLQLRWETDFRTLTRSRNLDRDVSFDAIEGHVGPFFESVVVREINSETGDVLDYENEPSLKAIAVGGNRLSRGLTLEGLMVSFFVRRSVTYDTLMQMGRWFGFRPGYEDLTRIYTTSELQSWFRDLAQVEQQLRDDIGVYERQKVTPYELGVRIQTHPSMLVTSRIKQRFASSITVQQSYSEKVVQTVRFPFSRPVDFATLAELSIQATRSLVRQLGTPSEWQSGPQWQNVPAKEILSFLTTYPVDTEIRNLSLPLLRSYITHQNEQGELVTWTVAVRGRDKKQRVLGDTLDLGTERAVNMISRTRLISDADSIGVLTTPGDESVGLNADQLAQVAERQRELNIGENPAARLVRSPANGLLLLYPISRSSGSESEHERTRRRLFDDPEGPLSRNLVGIAVSFPKSQNAQPVSGYLVGTAGWRPVE
jgi:hypothetical protein